MQTIQTVEQLEALYGAPVEAATAKDVDCVTPEYAEFIAASPFLTLASSGPEGLDCSPRGDFPGFVRLVDPRTLLLPDRRGNNRVDSLRNIVRDPRIALLFFVPGAGNTLRVNGRAELCIDPPLLDSFAVEGKAPRAVIVLRVEQAFFQCARAIMRSELWNPSKHVDPRTLPSPGRMLASLTNDRVGGPSYDDAWLARAKDSLW